MTGPQVRGLPGAQPHWDRDADVVVVGSGAAGITVALAAARHGRRVLLLSKDGIGDGSTPLAQGGLAAAIGPGDHPSLHQQDTLVAGAGLCDPAAVATLVSEAPGEITGLAGLGARLERTALHLEGGHRRKRIVHAGGDAIGAEVHKVLHAALLASPVEILTRCVALDALTDDRGAARGVLAGMASDDGTLDTGMVTARAVVLATGGFGQAYATTTNPAGVTGDGLALAARAGATMLAKNVAMEVARTGVQVNVVGTNFMDFPEFLRANRAEEPEGRARVEAMVLDRGGDGAGKIASLRAYWEFDGLEMVEL